MKNTLWSLLKIIAILVALGVAAHPGYALAQDNSGSSGTIGGAILFIVVIIAGLFILFPSRWPKKGTL